MKAASSTVKSTDGECPVGQSKPSTMITTSSPSQIRQGRKPTANRATTRGKFASFVADDYISPSNHPNDVCFVDIDASIAVHLIQTTDQLADVSSIPPASTPSTSIGCPQSSVFCLHCDRCRLHGVRRLLLSLDDCVDCHRRCTIRCPCQPPIHVSSNDDNISVGMAQS
ncbi:hypothetical protein ACLOJK_014525 [Asimina triloba]